MAAAPRRASARPAALAGGLLLGATCLAGCVPGGSEDAGPVATPAAVAPAPVPAAPPAPPAPTWETTVAAVRSGAARVAAVGCTGTSAGSGFLVAPGLLLTAAPVVAGATSVSVAFGPDVYPAALAGLDPVSGLAALRVLGEPPVGRPLAVAVAPAVAGTEVTALAASAEGGPEALHGAVTAVEPPSEQRPAGSLRTDAAGTGGAGAALVDLTGAVVGVVAAEAGAAVPQEAVDRAVRAWRDAPALPPAPGCALPRRPGDDVRVDVVVSSPAPEAAAVAQLLQLHGDSLDRGAADVAWHLLLPAAQAQHVDLGTFAADHATTTWLDLDVAQVERTGEATAEALVRVRTTQAAEHGPDGQTCSRWSLRYALALEGGTWRIAGSRNEVGSPEPCAGTEPPPPVEVPAEEFPADAGLEALGAPPAAGGAPAA